MKPNFVPLLYIHGILQENDIELPPLNAIFRSLEHSHQVCQMSNIWLLAHQTPKDKIHEVFHMLKVLAFLANLLQYNYIDRSVL